MSLFSETITAEIHAAQERLEVFCVDGDDAGVAVTSGRLEELHRLAEVHEVVVPVA